VKHKTEVEVVRAAIPNTASGWTYGGLLVRDVSKPGSEPFWISPTDFSLVPHWDCGLENLQMFANQTVLARTVEEVRGVTSLGDWVDLPKGARVICDMSDHQRRMGGDIACFAYKRYRYGYGGIPVGLESDSLEVLY
jgi:hypothetical protein